MTQLRAPTGSSLSDTARQQRASAAPLADLLPVDHLAILRFGTASQKKALKTLWPAMELTLKKGLEDRADITTQKWISTEDKKTSALLLGLRLTAPAPTSGPSLILGPHAGPDSTEAADFQKFWGGNESCDLRRFEDGSIRESVSLHNPWGAPYTAMAVIRHLLKVHHEGQAELEPLIIPSELLPSSLMSLESLKRARGAMDAFSKVVLASADPSLPVRKVRGLASVLHYGGELDAYRAPSKVGKKLVERNKGGALILKSGARAAPSLTKAIPVMLDITHKKNMNAAMFEHLKLAFLVNLKNKLVERGLKTLLKDRKLYVEHETFLFAIDVDPPVTAAADGDADAVHAQAIYSYLQSLALRHSAWPGAFHLARSWVSAKMLESVIPELALELILAHVFAHPVSNIGSPETVETALLRFLDLLSFHHFETEPLFINEDDAIPMKAVASVRTMHKDNRSALPALTIVTPFDGKTTPSLFTKGVSKPDLKRMINLARQTLCHLMQSSNSCPLDFKSFEETLSCDLSVYDVTIALKPLQQPLVKEREANDEFLKGEAKRLMDAFPVVDYNPVESYLSELKETFGDVARFYHGRGCPVIGVKLNQSVLEQTEVVGFRQIAGKKVADSGEALVQNVEAFVQDFKILGTGLVKEVECNIK